MDKQIFYTDGYKYQLEVGYRHQTTIRPKAPIMTRYLDLYMDGLLRIKEGYSWDGPSGSIDTKNSMRASLVHDALCQLINEGLLDKHNQPYADSLLYEICLADGMSKARAWLWYRAVRRYDKSGLKPYEPKEVMTAP